MPLAFYRQRGLAAPAVHYSVKSYRLDIQSHKFAEVVRECLPAGACAAVCHAVLRVVLALEDFHRRLIRYWVFLCACVLLLYDFVECGGLEARRLVLQYRTYGLAHAPQPACVCDFHALIERAAYEAVPRGVKLHDG